MPVSTRLLVPTARVLCRTAGWLLILAGASVLVSAWSVAFPGPGSGLG